MQFSLFDDHRSMTIRFGGDVTNVDESDALGRDYLRVVAFHPRHLPADQALVSVESFCCGWEKCVR